MSVINQVEVKLLEIPDLGIMKPFGKAWARQKVEGMDVGYWNNPIDYAATFVKDDDGRSGSRPATSARGCSMMTEK